MWVNYICNGVIIRWTTKCSRESLSIGWRKFKPHRGRKGREGNVRQVEKGKLIILDIAEWGNACRGKCNPRSSTNLPYTSMITIANFGKHHFSSHPPLHTHTLQSPSPRYKI